VGLPQSLVAQAVAALYIVQRPVSAINRLRALVHQAKVLPGAAVLVEMVAAVAVAQVQSVVRGQEALGEQVAQVCHQALPVLPLFMAVAVVAALAHLVVPGGLVAVALAYLAQRVVMPKMAPQTVVAVAAAATTTQVVEAARVDRAL
jgi:hypothetical protein